MRFWLTFDRSLIKVSKVLHRNASFSNNYNCPRSTSHISASVSPFIHTSAVVINSSLCYVLEPNLLQVFGSQQVNLPTIWKTRCNLKSRSSNFPLVDRGFEGHTIA